MTSTDLCREVLGQCIGFTHMDCIENSARKLARICQIYEEALRSSHTRECQWGSYPDKCKACCALAEAEKIAGGPTQRLKQIIGENLGTT